MVPQCGLEESGKPFDFELIDNCMNERVTFVLVRLQSFRAPVSKEFKSHWVLSVACPVQKVVVLNIFLQKEFGFPEFLHDIEV